MHVECEVTRSDAAALIVRGGSVRYIGQRNNYPPERVMLPSIVTGYAEMSYFTSQLATTNVLFLIQNS